MENLNIETVKNKRTHFRNYQGGYLQVLISPEMTNGSLAIIDMTLPKGSEPPVHLHTREDETFYLLEGEMKFKVGGKVINAKKGEAIFAERGIVHQFEILSDSARFLTVITPGHFLEYFLEFSFPTEELPSLASPSAPPPLEAILYMTKKLNEKYGIMFI